MSPPPEHVVVVGAGIAGLAAAAKLSRQGVPVTVCEKESFPGGKIRQGMTPLGPIDLGPTVCTMPWVFDELLDGKTDNLMSRLKAEPLEVLAHHRWPDGSRFNLYHDPARSMQAVAEFAGLAEARRFQRFQSLSRRLHDALLESFLKTARPSLAGLVRRAGPAGLVALGQAWPFFSLWTRLGQLFRDPRLRQLFARYATYCGSSPLAAPATLMLIAHVEQCGVWRMRGGMKEIANALEQTATGQGTKFLYGREVKAIHVAGGRASGVEWEDGSRLQASHVITNCDLRALSSGALGKQVKSVVPSRQIKERSLSAITWNGLADLGDEQLEHHNVLFSRDYPTEFQDLFGRRTLPESPTVYLCASDRPVPVNHQPGDRERTFLLINAPADGDKPEKNWPALAQAACAGVIAQLKACGINPGPDVTSFDITTPADFHQRFPATGGALYGGVTHGWRGAFARPGVATRLPGLYLAGGGVHPGPGVPMAALSGLAAARCVMAELESGARSRKLDLARA